MVLLSTVSKAMSHTSLMLKGPRVIPLAVLKTHNSMRVLVKQKYLIKSVTVHNSQFK